MNAMISFSDAECTAEMGLVPSGTVPCSTEEFTAMPCSVKRCANTCAASRAGCVLKAGYALNTSGSAGLAPFQLRPPSTAMDAVGA